jgi:hypothetical protein
MPNWIVALCMMMLSPVAAVAAGSVQQSWLMMVSTENTDPSRASEFNDWYDHVDIPDVLKVPGYERARRGVEESIAEYSSGATERTAAKYVALYDIKSRAIDKTIIDMLMASWGMEKSHHSTDLLKVTERVYFRQYGAIRARLNPDPSKRNEYLYLARFNCCRNPSAARDFDAWYDSKYAAAVLASSGFTRIVRYKLYRVLMDHPVEMPEFLSILELTADSAAQAAQAVNEVRTKLSGADRENLPILEKSRSMFLKINDVKRQLGPAGESRLRLFHVILDAIS